VSSVQHAVCAKRFDVREVQTRTCYTAFVRVNIHVCMDVAHVHSKADLHVCQTIYVHAHIIFVKRLPHENRMISSRQTNMHACVRQSLSSLGYFSKSGLTLGDDAVFLRCCVPICTGRSFDARYARQDSGYEK
jgi:hypothetical protein